MPYRETNVFSVTVIKAGDFNPGTDWAAMSNHEGAATAETQERTYTNLGEPNAEINTARLKYYSDAAGNTEITNADSGYTIGDGSDTETLDNVLAVSTSGNTVTITLDTSGVGIDDANNNIVFYAKLEINQPDP